MVMDKRAPIFVAGHRGLVGSAVVRRLVEDGWSDIRTVDHGGLDLREQAAVRAWFETERPAYVVLAAARAGGILANSTFPADFLADNLYIQANVIEASRRAGVKKLVILGSSCIYPRMAHQPIDESELLNGPLEQTNEPYAIAKIAGLKMAQAYRKQHGLNAICLMPTNLFGPNDNFSREGSHVIPGLLRRLHEAKLDGADRVVVWGTGNPRREFLYVDDLADAIVTLLESYDGAELLNIGTGKDITIRELAAEVREVVGYQGELVFDASKPDGTPRKLLDVSKIFALGWRPKTSLREGLRRAYAWFVDNPASARL
jgi:GDP-L-fucose synthase